MDKEEINFTTGSKALTEWKNEPDVADLKADLLAAKGSHSEHISKIRNWRDAYNAEGKYKPKHQEGSSSVQPKLVRKQAEWRYPALSEPFLSSDKLFEITPTTFEDVTAAEQNELVLNWQFRTKINLVKFIDEYVRTVVDEGTVIVQSGWERVTEPITELVPVFEHYPVEDEEAAQMLHQAAEIYNQDPRGFDEAFDEATKAAVEHLLETGEPTYAVQVDTQEVETEKILENKPVLSILNPENVYIDPSCEGVVDDALFVIKSFEVNLASLQRTGLYKNLDSIDWDGATLNDGEHISSTPSSFEFKDRARKKAVAYEYWGYYDVEDDGVLVPIVATWVGNTLIRLEENPFPGGKLPFEVVDYLPVKRSIYGEPDAELIVDNQSIVGAVLRGTIDLMAKSANGQTGFPKNMLDPMNKLLFKKGLDYEYNMTAGNPEHSIVHHKFPEIPNSVITMYQMQHSDAEAMTGTKSFSGGISGDSYGKVATGVRGALSAAGAREMSILRRLAEGIKRIGVKVCEMNAVFLSEKEVVRVTNSQFVEIKREDLVGNYDLKVDISTSEIDDAKSQDLGFMLQTIGPNMDPTINTKILAKIAKLKRMPDLAEMLERWEPQPDPHTEALKQIELERAQLQNQLLQAQIQKVMAETIESEVEFTKGQLELEETNQGIKHARDLERIQSQAEANQRLEITKALSRGRKLDDVPGNIEAAIAYNSVAKDLERSN